MTIIIFFLDWWHILMYPSIATDQVLDVELIKSEPT